LSFPEKQLIWIIIHENPTVEQSKTGKKFRKKLRKIYNFSWKSIDSKRFHAIIKTNI